MSNDITIAVPGGRLLRPGDRIRLHRFDTDMWVVYYGWYAWGGNREVCGWYLQRLGPDHIIKPLQKTDLDDLYFIETSGDTTYIP